MKITDELDQISHSATNVKRITGSFLSLLLFLFSSAVFAQTPAPSGLWVTATSDTSVSLSWTGPTDTGNNGQLWGHNILRCEGATCTSPVYHAFASGSGVTTYTDTGGDSNDFTTGTTYRYVVQASWETGGLSAWSNYVTATAQASTGQPTGLTVISSSPSAISLSWTAPPDDGSGALDGYNVNRCTGTDCTPVYYAWVPSGTSYTDSDVTSGTTYRYSVTASRNSILGFQSNWVTAMARTTRDEEEPGKPVGLTVTSVSAEAITLRWRSSTGRDAEFGYYIFRCTVPEDATSCEPYDGIWLAALENTNTYTDTEVTPGETYRYQVESQPFNGENLSRALTVTAQMSDEVPAPTDLTVTETTSTLVRLSWTAPEDDGRGAIQAIHIYRCNVDQSPNCSEFLHLTSRNPALTEFRDNDVEPNTTYRYAVASYRSAGEASPWSNEVMATTDRGSYASPTDLTVTKTFRNAISLSWTAPAEGILGYNIYRCLVPFGESSCNPAWHAWVANPGNAPPAPTSYTDTGGDTGDITRNLTYLYVVAASYPPHYRNGDWSEAVTATAEGGSLPRPIPRDLTVTAVSETAISLSWTAPVGVSVRGYDVWRCVEGDTPCTPAYLAWVTNGDGDPPPAPTKYTDTDVTPGTTYRYVVCASVGDDFTKTPRSNQVTATTEGEPLTEPDPPTSLKVTAVSETAVSLGWTAPADDIEAYDVLRCELGEEASCDLEFYAWVASDGDATPPAPTEYTDTGVTPGTNYLYAVEALRYDKTVDPWGQFRSERSNEVTVTAEGEPSPEPEPPAVEVPTAPTSLKVTAVSETAVSLGWTAPADDIEAYDVLRCELGEEASCDLEFYAWVASDGDATPPAPTEYTDTGVTPGTNYLYAVEALRYDKTVDPWEQFRSERSNEVTATTEGEAEPEPPVAEVSAPTDLTVTAASVEGISLRWNAPAGVEVRGYDVWRCVEGDVACTPTFLAWVTNGDGDPPPAPTEYTDTNVIPGATYRYVVFASVGNDYTKTPRSNQVTATTEGETEPKPPVVEAPAPTNLTVTATSEDGISLSWTAPAGETNVRGYNVFRCVSPCTLDSSDRSSWLAWVTQGEGDPHPAPTTYTDTSVTSGTTYVYAVEAEVNDDYARSAWSNQVTASTEGEPTSEPEPPAGDVPAAPTDLTVTAVGDASISLGWTAPADDIEAYDVLRCELGEEASCELEFHAWVSSDGDATPPAPTEYTDTGVTPGTNYLYAVEALRYDKTVDPWGQFRSERSNEVTVTAEGEPSPEPEPPVEEVQPPTNLTVTAAGVDGISLSWTAPAGIDVRGYNVLRCQERTDTPCTPEWQAWVTAGDGDPPPAPTEYTDTNVIPGNTYRYTVEAKFGDNYDSTPFSNEVTAQAGDPAASGPSPEERAMTLESGLAALGRTVAGQAVDSLSGRFASLSSSPGTQAAASLRPDAFSDALTMAAEQMGIPLAVADINDVVHAGPEWGPWMSDRDLLTHSCGSTVSGCPDETDGNLVAGSLTLRQLWSQNSFQMALGESEDGSAPAWTLWGRGSISGFEGQPRDGLDLDGELVSGFLGLDYRWGTDTLLGVAVSHSQGDIDYGEIDYGEADNGPGELETTLRSVYPYAYWSPRPGLGLWGVLGYGFGETALTDVTANNLETDVEMWMAALGGRSDLLTLGRVDLALKADAFTVRLESDKAEALKSADVDSNRVRLALEGSTRLALSEHSLLTPSLELGARWDTGDAETGLGAELGGGLAYTNTRLGLSVEASGRYLLTHEEETFEEWGASLAACMSSGADGTGLALSLRPVWGNASSGVDALWGADGGARVGATALTTPNRASWQPDRLDLGLRYGSETPRGLFSPFGEVGLQGSDNYSMRIGTQLDTTTGWKLDVFGGHVSRQAETADNLVGLTASYGFGAAAMNQAFAGTMPAASSWSTCDKGPVEKTAARNEPVMRRQETAGTQPDKDANNDHNPATGDYLTVTTVTRESGTVSRETLPIDQENYSDRVIVPDRMEESDNWFVPVTNASPPPIVVAQQTDEASEPASRAGEETNANEAPAASGGTGGVADEVVSGSMEEITVKGIRRSLKDALEVKRSSDHIVDTLSLEDIDALPNVTIAEALVQLPGVNGTRDRGNQSQATIRGLGPRMVLGTVNGREVASSEPSRNIRWEQYPSELISQVQVYKTQSADLIAGGIAGTVNLETVAPLDYDGPKYTFSGVGAYYEGGKDIPDYNQWGNKLSGSLVKSFNNKVGVALGVASQKQKNAFPSYQGWGFNLPASWQPDLPAGGGDLDGMGTTGIVPWGGQIEVGKIETDRIGLLGTLQFRPSDAIDIRYDALYSEFDMDIEQDHTWYQGTGNLNNLQAGHYSDVVVVDDRALAATAQSPVPDCDHRPDGSIPQCFDIRHVLAMYDQENSVFTQGLNLEFSGESIQVNADIAYSRAERNNYWHGLYFDDLNATFRYDFRGTPSVSVPEGSPSTRPETAELVVVDCNTGFCGSGSDNEGSHLEDEHWSYHVNINKALDVGHLNSLDLGIRYSNRGKEVTWEQFKMPRGGDNPAQTLPDGFSSYTLSAFDTSPILTAPSFIAAASPFGGLDFSLAYINEERYWKVSEENLAGYVKANFEGSIGASRYYTANVGVRFVDVGTESFDIRGASIGNDYTEVLPSTSINFFLDEENIIRLSASRAISRPPLDELRVARLINAPSGSIDGNTGNPLLTPMVSKQLDLSYEWYFAPESLAAATAYYKKIDDYIGYTSFALGIRDGRQFAIYGPKNEQEGYIRGVELTFQAPFTSLLPKALKGVSAGIYSNYAYADSNIKELYPEDNPYSLAGLAKHTAAVDLWFWREPLDLRFGWKYHSAFTTGFGWDGSELNTLDAESNFSASLAYLLTDNITLRVQGYNLTNERARITRNNNEHDLRRFDKYGRTYFFGVSWKMW